MINYEITIIYFDNAGSLSIRRLKYRSLKNTSFRKNDSDVLSKKHCVPTLVPRRRRAVLLIQDFDY